MNYGMYLAASGMLTNMYRQDVFANNLANAQTTAFKPDIPELRQRDPASVETNASGDFSRRLLDQLGGGVLAGPQRIDFTPGSTQMTGQPLDVAVDGPDNFLAVEAPSNGKQNAVSGPSVELTRDGRLSRDAQGYLITAADGSRVLSTTDQPIQLNGAGPATITGSGQVMQDGSTVAQLQITAVTDKTLLHKAGQNLFAWSGNKDIRKTPTSATVKPGFLESSGVDPVKGLVDVIDNTREIEDNANMIHYHDMLMDRAINTLGRVA